VDRGFEVIVHDSGSARPAADPSSSLLLGSMKNLELSSLGVD
jgi:hypothetical protein